MKHIHFFGLGPQRTATTWLYQALLPSQAICLPQGVKETMFFDRYYDKGLNWYLWHFRQATADQLCGEIAPTYFDAPAACERLSQHFPDAKLIINVRNPVARCHSLFRHHLSKGRVPNDFWKAAESVPQIIDSGHYRKHGSRWEDQFPNIHYLVQEDIVAQPETEIANLQSFLGIPIRLPASAEQLKEKVNVAEAPRFPRLARLASASAAFLRSRRLHRVAELGKRLGLKKVYRGGTEVAAFDPETRRRLQDLYASDIQWLEKRLNRCFADWLN